MSLSKASVVGDHFLHSLDPNVLFRVIFREKLDACHSKG